MKKKYIHNIEQLDDFIEKQKAFEVGAIFAVNVMNQSNVRKMSFIQPMLRVAAVFIVILGGIVVGSKLGNAFIINTPHEIADTLELTSDTYMAFEKYFYEE